MDWNLMLEVLTATGWEAWIVDHDLSLSDCWAMLTDWRVENPDVNLYCERGEGGE